MKKLESKKESDIHSQESQKRNIQESQLENKGSNTTRGIQKFNQLPIESNTSTNALIDCDKIIQE